MFALFNIERYALKVNMTLTFKSKSNQIMKASYYHIFHYHQILPFLIGSWVRSTLTDAECILANKKPNNTSITHQIKGSETPRNHAEFETEGSKLHETTDNLNKNRTPYMMYMYSNSSII